MWIGFEVADLLAILLLVFLEGILSMDNALVLAISVKHLPPDKRSKALSYGIVGAFVFRFIALFFLADLIHFTTVKLLGAAYLLWIGVSHFILKNSVANAEKSLIQKGFWSTVLTVELIDMVFSIDSITAALAVSNRFIIIFIGGVLGIVMMRFFATLFCELIQKFPKLESVAYGLVTIVGLKLGLQTWLN